MTTGPREVVSLRIERSIGWIVVDNPPVNALSHAVRDGICRHLLDASANPSVKAIVLVCEGTTFSVGADIREFGKPAKEPMLAAVNAAVESSDKLVIAALHGNVLGGGLELAMACHGRIAAKGTKLGLPEVKLGLIPGAGGTQRLPRLIGMTAALEMIASGRSMGIDEALRSGLVDAVADDGLLAAAETLALKLAEQDPRRTGSLPVPPFDDAAFTEGTGDALRKARGQLSPVRAAEAVALASRLPFSEGLARERQIFDELIGSRQSKALRYAFFAEREAGKMPKLADAHARSLGSIGIIGAGTMGAGIAVACLDAGLRVVVVETTDIALQSGRDRIAALYERQRKSGRLSPVEMDIRQSRLSMSTDYGDLSASDVIIEAAFEDMALKRQIFASLGAIAKPTAVLATNTSYLDVDAIAASSGRPADVIGLHFFSPANIMRLVEVIEARHSMPDAVATGVALSKALGKLPVLSGVCDGFIGNRLWSRYRRVVDAALEDGALPHEVDEAMEGWGFSMGPLAVSDLAGLDIGFAQRRRQDASRRADERYAATVADELCAMGRLGQKTGRGYYLYSDGKRRIDPEVTELVKRVSAQKHIHRRAIPPETLQSQIHAALVNEGANILREGIAMRASDIDVVLLNGYGYPRWRGGPMFEADDIGLKEILGQVVSLKESLGFGFEPAPLLLSLAKSGRTFASLGPGEAERIGEI